jgi:putative peptidoglycan lipid II flippase
LAGLPASAGVAGWIEYLLLRGSLRRRVGAFSIPRMLVVSLWGSAASSAALAYPLKFWLSGHPLIAGIVILPFYGLLYVGATLLLRIQEANVIVARLWRWK